MRGRCSVCSYSARLLVDGRTALHAVWFGSERRVCAGSHKPPKGEP